MVQRLNPLGGLLDFFLAWRTGKNHVDEGHLLVAVGQSLQRVKWDEVIRYRGALADMFTASQGLLVHQLSLEAQFKKWLNDIQASDKMTPAEQTDAPYRLRMMMSHIRNAKKDGIPIP